MVRILGFHPSDESSILSGVTTFLGDKFMSIQDEYNKERRKQYLKWEAFINKETRERLERYYALGNRKTRRKQASIARKKKEK